MKRRSAPSADRLAKTLQPVRSWFRARGWTPFDFQREAWDVHLSGKSGLIRAPTGVGKTYAACFGKTRALLPAFGSFTGSKVIRPAAGDRVFAVAEGEIVRIGRPASSRSA
jgi:ATP-dependent Lhr-like helicase